MSDALHQAQLATLLAQAAAAGLEADRGQYCADPEDGLKFFAESVRSTILPRSLQFFCDGAPCLKAIAKGGSLMELGDAPGKGATRPVQASEIPAIKALLRDVFAAGTVISMTSSPVSLRPVSMQIGIQGDALLQAFGLRQRPSYPNERLDILIEAAFDVTLAILRRDGDEKLFPAGRALAAEARPWVQQVFAALATEKYPLTEEKLLTLYPHFLPELAACFHVAGSEMTAILIHRDAAEDVVAFWTAMGR